MDKEIVTQVIDALRQRFEELGDKAYTMTLSQLADYMGLTGEIRRIFFLSMVSNQAVAKAMYDGKQCTCGSTAEFDNKETYFIHEGKGYVKLYFRCPGCHHELEEDFRAPSQDNLRPDGILSTITFKKDENGCLRPDKREYHD